MKICVLILTLFLFAVSAFAVTYTWTDEQGTMNFTEDYGHIPKKYRKKAKTLGEEEPEPPVAAEPERKEKSRPQNETAPQTKEPSSQGSHEKKAALFGGKEGTAWKADFGQVKSDVKATEDQLVEMRGRLADTSKMSRTEYLSIQATLRNLESRILELRKKRDLLTEEANRAKVPEEYR